MKIYFHIAIGGIFGALLRYMVKDITVFGYHGSFPLNTFLINISGGLGLGIFITLAFDYLEIDPELRLGIATGFFGAYTTFSSLCKENVTLIQQGHIIQALYYPAASLFFGLLATFSGIIFAKAIIRILSEAKT